MKQTFFCERIAYCFAQLHIVQHNGKKVFNNKLINCDVFDSCRPEF